MCAFRGTCRRTRDSLRRIVWRRHPDVDEYRDFHARAMG